MTICTREIRSNHSVLQRLSPPAVSSIEETNVIEVLPDLPDGVTGIRVSGQLTGPELQAFEPMMAPLLDRDPLRFLEVIETDYRGFGHGGLIADAKQSIGALIHHRSASTRIAIVTDLTWIPHAVHALAWLVPGHIAVFDRTDVTTAIRWLSDPTPQPNPTTDK